MKILIDLNLKEKITMIMVTHDVGLKNFATRVVRMADGKVSKIQIIPESTRSHMIKELNSRVAASLKGQDKGQLMIREGIFNNGDEVKRIPDNFRSVIDASSASKTSVRRPKDYPVL